MRIVVALLAALALAAPAQAAAKPKQHFLATSYSMVVGDDERWIAFKPSPTSLRVLDERERTSYELAVREHCEPADAGSGYVLVSCVEPDGAVSTHVLSARTRAIRQIGFPEHSRGYSAIGRHWLKGMDSSFAHQVRVYTTWTGEGRQEDTLQDDNGNLDGSDYRPRDLDRLDLAPVAPLVPGDSVFRFEPPYSVAQRGRGSGGQLAQLVLLRDGDATRFGRLVKLLARCESPCFSIQYGGGIASWVQRRTVKTYRRLGDRRLEWHFRRRPAYVEHSARRVFTALYTDAPFVFDVYVAPLR